MFKVRRLGKSVIYAFRGLVKTFQEEQNLRFHLAAAVLVVIAGIWIGLTGIEWAVIAVAIGLVMMMELVNSGVERVSDLLKPRLDHYVKEIKDIMAAAVLFSALLAVIIGIIIFFPRLYPLILRYIQ